MTREQKRYFLCFLIALLIHFLVLYRVSVVSEPEIVADEALDLILKEYQIADIEKPKKEERPEEAKFVGNYDSRVKEEQVAPSPLTPSVPQQPAEQIEPEEKEAEQTETDSLAAKYAMRTEQKEPQQETPQKDSGSAGKLPEDFYPDFKMGEHTYLNVLRYPEVEYFVRLKRIFKITFDPAAALRHAYSSNLVSRGQVEVVLGIEVAASGKLAKLFVINSSGINTYDEEALRTVRDSAPFAQPPKEFLSPDSKLRMSWTFTVYL